MTDEEARSWLRQWQYKHGYAKLRRSAGTAQSSSLNARCQHLERNRLRKHKPPHGVHTHPRVRYLIAYNTCTYTNTYTNTNTNPNKTSQDDIMRLYSTVHILVGTPGRILDLANKGVAGVFCVCPCPCVFACVCVCLRVHVVSGCVASAAS